MRRVMEYEEVTLDTVIKEQEVRIYIKEERKEVVPDAWVYRATREKHGKFRLQIFLPYSPLLSWVGKVRKIA